MDESSGSRTILRTLFIALWFGLGAVFVGWQLSGGTLTDAVRKVAHIEDKKDGADAGDGITFGGETHQLSLGGEDSDEEDAEAAEANEADAESIDEGDDQASEDDDDSESADTADAGESVEGDVQSDEPEDPQYEAAADTGSTDDDDEEDEDDHVGIGDDE